MDWIGCGAFWVAISYRLAACFIWIWSTCRTEIYWRLFRHFGNYNDSLRKILVKKMTTIGQKLHKMALFLYIFRIYSLKNFAVGGLGSGTAPRSPPPTSTPLYCITAWSVCICSSIGLQVSCSEGTLTIAPEALGVPGRRCMASAMAHARTLSRGAGLWHHAIAY